MDLKQKNSITLKSPSSRITLLRPHLGQHAYYKSQKRFNVVPAGRRSGKTEIAKRRLIARALCRSFYGSKKYVGGRYAACAPTRDQAKRIYWKDLKAMFPKKYWSRKPSESELIIFLKNDVEIYVIGMDVPERIEGTPWDHIIMDEYGNMKEEAWKEHVFPALADRKGSCDLIGVPEGRNHYYDRYKEALSDEFSYMQAHHWKSSEILDAEEIELAKRMLDKLTYEQEYEAAFVNFAGRAYYPFNEKNHCTSLMYDPRLPLIFCFDFNVQPGVAVVLQEQWLPKTFELIPDPKLFGNHPDAFVAALKYGQDGFIKRAVAGTAAIGEVWIPNNSTTVSVCNKLIEDWGHHKGLIKLYGDATGGARGTAQTQGSDWDIIWQMMTTKFGTNVDLNVPQANPSERSRINAFNTRLKTMDGVVRFKLDPSKTPHLKTDLEGVRLLEGGSGEIDKKHDRMLTHISDAVGYYLVKEYPIIEQVYGSEFKIRGLYG